MDSFRRNASISDDSSSGFWENKEYYDEPYTGKDAEEAEHPSPPEFVGHDSPYSWTQAWC